MTNRLLKLVRSALYAVLLGLLVYGFALTLPIDLALLFAGDVLLYFEIVSAVWLAAQAARLRHALDYARMAVHRPLRRLRGHARRFARRVRRLTAIGKSRDEDPRGAFAYA